MFVRAQNAKEACKVCKEQVLLQTGRNAFRPTTKVPDVESIRNNPYYVVD
jgi:hypothetical protein